MSNNEWPMYSNGVKKDEHRSKMMDQELVRKINANLRVLLEASGQKLKGPGEIKEWQIEE